eukprot:TRINITY_DN6700_c0_g1_i3.p1 TRINITY_DN6700_c0_g1~~TRINITY_DN6700_c0_g1_i3.p1  ORF type:complete len:1141 (-),score=256.26 TRINITY_DN6700_c0_g1_i3:888-4310(-)
MKHSQVPSPMSSPYVTQSLRTKHKRVNSRSPAHAYQAGNGKEHGPAEDAMAVAVAEHIAKLELAAGSKASIPVVRRAAPRERKPQASKSGGPRKVKEKEVMMPLTAAEVEGKPLLADFRIEISDDLRQMLNAKWTKDMDDTLREGVLRYGMSEWPKVMAHMQVLEDVESLECHQRWQIICDLPVKGPWASEEDDVLRALVEQYGIKKWSHVATGLPGRTGKQCRERWLNHLDIRVMKTSWTPEEDELLFDAQRELGNQWSKISRMLPGRAENAVKNRFNSLITKRRGYRTKPVDEADPYGIGIGECTRDQAALLSAASFSAKAAAQAAARASRKAAAKAEARANAVPKNAAKPTPARRKGAIGKRAVKKPPALPYSGGEQPVHKFLAADDGAEGDLLGDGEEIDVYGDAAYLLQTSHTQGYLDQWASAMPQRPSSTRSIGTAATMELSQSDVPSGVTRSPTYFGQLIAEDASGEQDDYGGLAVPVKDQAGGDSRGPQGGGGAGGRSTYNKQQQHKQMPPMQQHQHYHLHHHQHHHRHTFGPDSTQSQQRSPLPFDAQDAHGSPVKKHWELEDTIGATDVGFEAELGMNGIDPDDFWRGKGIALTKAGDRGDTGALYSMPHTNSGRALSSSRERAAQYALERRFQRGERGERTAEMLPEEMDRVTFMQSISNGSTGLDRLAGTGTLEMGRSKGLLQGGLAWDSSSSAPHRRLPEGGRRDDRDHRGLNRTAEVDSAIRARQLECRARDRGEDLMEPVITKASYAAVGSRHKAQEEGHGPLLKQVQISPEELRRLRQHIQTISVDGAIGNNSLGESCSLKLKLELHEASMQQDHHQRSRHQILERKAMECNGAVAHGSMGAAEHYPHTADGIIPPPLEIGSPEEAFEREYDSTNNKHKQRSGTVSSHASQHAGAVAGAHAAPIQGAPMNGDATMTSVAHLHLARNCEWIKIGKGTGQPNRKQPPSTGRSSIKDMESALRMSLASLSLEDEDWHFLAESEQQQRQQKPSQYRQQQQAQALADSYSGGIGMAGSDPMGSGTPGTRDSMAWDQMSLADTAGTPGGTDLNVDADDGAGAPRTLPMGQLLKEARVTRLGTTAGPHGRRPTTTTSKSPIARSLEELDLIQDPEQRRQQKGQFMEAVLMS